MELFSRENLEMFISQSYAKNMGLYGERVGALSIVVSDKSLVASVLGQLKRVIRPMYSTPPGYGAKIAAKILRKLLTLTTISSFLNTKIIFICGLFTPSSWDGSLGEIGTRSITRGSACVSETGTLSRSRRPSSSSFLLLK